MMIDHVTLASGNIFADLAVPDADDQLRKATIAAVIHRSMIDLGLSQRKASGIIGLPQAKLSNVLRGNFSGVSEDKLMTCAAALGHDVVISIAPRHEGAGRIAVLESAIAG